MAVNVERVNYSSRPIPKMRGDPLHNSLVAKASEAFSDFGFNTTLECAIALDDGRIDFVDLVAEHGDCLVACEVETTPRGVLSNAAKAGALNLPLWILVPNRKVLSAVSKKLNISSRKPGDREIKILLLGQLRQELMNCFPLFFPANVQRKNRKTNR